MHKTATHPTPFTRHGTAGRQAEISSTAIDNTFALITTTRQSHRTFVDATLELSHCPRTA